ncbi:MAG: hypothetical protein NC187_00940 [Candidatus Amulumruptor caecigallinarius]|nr:hypothetical protein [Candidatus Amulumruptor caecigallinarius]MCM1396041.1 hypothetical protein [Candidatus Amulumruptor caecigallinarius]MCM1453040.1 hypothetical protein [bacterium]
MRLFRYAAQWRPMPVFAVLTAVLALLFGCVFQAYPLCVDDLWYLSDATAQLGTIEALRQTWYICIDSMTFDTGRLSSLVLTPFLGFFPRWVFSLCSALCIWLVLMFGIKLSRVSPISGRSAYWLALVVFILPWYEFLFTMLYSANYVWATALGLTFLWVFFSRGRGSISPGRFCLLALLGVMTGWWHEGWTVPMACGLAVWAWMKGRACITRRRVLLAVSAACGFICRVAMPGFWLMPDRRSSQLVKSVWQETVINAVAFDCMFYLLAGVLLAVLLIPVLRRRWRTMEIDDRAFVVFAMVFGTVSTVIYLMYFNGARTGLFAQVICGLGVLRLSRAWGRRSRRMIVAGRVAFSLVWLASVINLVGAVKVQRGLTREFDEVWTVAHSKELAGMEPLVYFDPTPIRLDIDLYKGSYMLLNTKYGQWHMKLLPKAAEGFDPESPDVKRCSDPRLMLYGGLVFVEGVGSRDDLLITLDDGSQVRTRVRQRPFAISDGDSCAVLVTHWQLTHSGVTVTDAVYAD